MAFEGLSGKLQDAFKHLRGKGKLTEKDVKDAMREVKLALLEADVNFKIVKEFIANVTEKAVGGEILNSLTPGQHVVKIVNEELTALMGGEQSKLTVSARPPTVYMLVGLQGSGKTTACGKLAAQLRKQGKKPLLAACDVYRPAAIQQLQIVGKNYDIPVFEQGQGDPVKIAAAALEQAKRLSHDVLLIDTAGRLHIDEGLMDELVRLKAAVTPTETLLVVDAMTGQDAVNVAGRFNEIVGVDGIILTKLDGDTRGGAAISVRKATGKPIKYVGQGEKAEDLEPFHPERMAGRILGMGDVLSLVEKAQAAFDEKEAAELEKKIRKNDLDLQDFLNQMRQMKKMGPLKNVLGMIPGLGGAIPQDAEIDESRLGRTEAIILSMTPKERQNPAVINGSRKRRISAGSGCSIQDVNRLLKQFEDMKRMMKQFGGMGKKGKMPLPFMK